MPCSIVDQTHNEMEGTLSSRFLKNEEVFLCFLYIRQCSAYGVMYPCGDL